MALVPYNIPNVDERLEEIITTQFRDQPVIHKFLRLWTAEIEDLFVVWQSLAQDRDIDSATGDVLDIIGRIVGQERTIVGADLYDFFGFRGHIQALGFGDTYVEGVGGRWWSLGAPMGGNVTLDDEQYRLLIKARIMRNTSRGTPEDMLRYIQFVFGVEGKFTWNEGAMARVGVGRKLSNFEKALIAAEFTFQKYPTYYSPKPLGVGLELFEYDSLGTLGFIGTPNAKGMITLSNPTFDGGVFGSVKYFSEIPSQPPTYEADFTKSAVLPANINFTRASTATYFGSDGFLRTAAVNEPVFEYTPGGVFRGWRVEQTSTNLITHNQLAGATAGIVGSGGNIPTGWSVTNKSVSGLDTEVVSVTTEQGIPCVDLRFFGTPITAYQAINFGNITGVVPSTAYTGSVFLTKRTGTVLAQGSLQFQVRYNVSPSGSVNITQNYTPQQLTGNLSNNRLVTSGDTSAQATGGGSLLAIFNFPANVALDFTVRVALPQVEQLSAVTSPIFTNGATATRATEVPRSNPLTLPFDGFTAYIECTRQNILGTYPIMFSDSPVNLGSYVGTRFTPSTVYLNTLEGIRTNPLDIPQLGENMRLSFSVSNVPSLNRVALNGILSNERVITPGVVNFSQRNIMKFGTTSGTTNGTFYIKKYAIYTTVFSEDQLNYLTYAG